MTQSFALAIVADGERSEYPGQPGAHFDVAAATSDARLIDLATAELHKIVPHAGSYVSESNYFNSNWQEAY